jgi:hypothetical protein
VVDGSAECAGTNARRLVQGDFRREGSRRVCEASRSAGDGVDLEREVRADVFVFAMQTATTHDFYDLLDVAQWEFYVVPAHAVRAVGTRSVRMSFMRNVAGEPTSWADLGEAIDRVYAAERRERGSD